MIVEAMNMKEHKAYFATDEDCHFLGHGTFSRILIDFDCVMTMNNKGYKPTVHAVEAFQELQKMGYSLFLNKVPVQEEILDALDSFFDYPFCCDEDPCRYTDSCDHWNTVSRNVETRLALEEQMTCDRRFRYEDNWLEIVQMIKENDPIAKVKCAYIKYDDIDWSQPKIKNGLIDEKGKQVLGSSYIEVEKMNNSTTKLLKKISIPRTQHPIKDDDFYKERFNERWNIESIIWDVKPEIASKYGARIEIEQYSLYYRGTWLEIRVKSNQITLDILYNLLAKFCADFGFDNKEELSYIWGYDLPWTEEQKKRAEEDDKTDWFFDPLDNDS